MIDAIHAQISIRRQCTLIDFNRSSFYYQAAGETPLNLELMQRIDQQYTKTPFYGWPRMTTYLRGLGYEINHKRVQRLMQLMGLQGVAPKRRTSTPAPGHKIYPYLLRGVDITSPDQVWSTDITYVSLPTGFMYLTAVLDWYSRYVLAWQLSNSLDSYFCVQALRHALQQGTPEIFNSDQGAQFTAHAFTSVLEQADIRISMDGRGRVFDNIFIERLWRSVKYEDLYLKAYETVAALQAGLAAYFTFYNYERPHQSLQYQVPAKVYGQR